MGRRDPECIKIFSYYKLFEIYINVFSGVVEVHALWFRVFLDKIDSLVSIADADMQYHWHSAAYMEFNDYNIEGLKRQKKMR